VGWWSGLLAGRNHVIAVDIDEDKIARLKRGGYGYEDLRRG
jgi:hypothetical protein